MLKQKNKRNILPPLQRRILLCFAKKGSQTINEVTTNIPLLGLAKRSHYKPTWLAIRSLTEKGLIQEVGLKEYRGRNYPQFWLTDDGALVALTEGAPLENLLELTKQIYPDNQMLVFYLDVTSKITPEAFQAGYSAIQQKGSLDTIDLVKLVLIEMETKNPDQKIEEIVNTLKTYPNEYVMFKKGMKKILQNLNKLEEIA